MERTITPIGVGGAFTVKGYNTNFLIRSGRRLALLDCGVSAFRALSALGVKLKDIDAAYVSHMHLDHVGGLHDLAIQRFIAGLPPPELYFHKRLAPDIWDRFLASHLTYVVDMSGSALQGTPEMFFKFVPVETTIYDSEEAFDFCGLKARLVPTKHAGEMPVHGVVLEDKYFFTTDTVFMPQQLEKVADKFGIELCFHDCSFVEQRLHAQYKELCTLPRDLRELLVLVHYEDFVDPESGECSIPLARAGERFVISSAA